MKLAASDEEGVTLLCTPVALPTSGITECVTEAVDDAEVILFGSAGNWPERFDGPAFVPPKTPSRQRSTRSTRRLPPTGSAG